MKIWQRNLIVCWFGMFVTMIGMSQIAPILPLYIKQLGIHNSALIEQFSGIAFGGTYIIAAVFSPIWGHAADKYGRKPMLLRASLGMSVIVFCIGFAHNIYQLIGLRLLQGIITGLSTGLRGFWRINSGRSGCSPLGYKVRILYYKCLVIAQRTVGIFEGLPKTGEEQ